MVPDEHPGPLSIRLPFPFKYPSDTKNFVPVKSPH